MSEYSNAYRNGGGGGCGCLSLTIFLIFLWLFFTDRLAVLFDAIITAIQNP